MEKKLDMSTSWKWVGDCQLGQHVFSVWDRYDENFRLRYAITSNRITTPSQFVTKLQVLRTFVRSCNLLSRGIETKGVVYRRSTGNQ